MKCYKYLLTKKMIKNAGIQTSICLKNRSKTPTKHNFPLNYGNFNMYDLPNKMYCVSRKVT